MIGRHQSPSSGPPRTRSTTPSQPARAERASARSGRRSARSSRRAGGRAGCPGSRRARSGAEPRARRRLGALGVPPRSSFGARLRSRVPQYGHSVMYGDTSEPQLLQTTKRSGPLAMGIQGYAPHGRRGKALGSYWLQDTLELEENRFPWHSAMTASCTSWPSTTAGRSRRRCSGSRAIPPPEETERIADAKRLIFEGMELAVERGVDAARDRRARRRAVRLGHPEARQGGGPRALDAGREVRPGRVRLPVRRRLRRAHRAVRRRLRQGARPLQPGRRRRR